MTLVVDLTDHRFGKLVVFRRAPSTKHGRAVWFCRCDCGQVTEAIGNNLLRRNSTSCGCSRIASNVKRLTTHGQAGNRRRSYTYNSWRGMVDRCTQQSHRRFADYGGRGIRICEHWNVFENFIADMGERPAGLTLDRIDVNGDYEPGNCRWATPYQQRHNRRSAPQMARIREPA